MSSPAYETVELEMAVNKAIYIEMTGVDSDEECVVEGDLSVYGLVGPYENDDSLMACGVFFYSEYHAPGDWGQLYLTQNDDWLNIIITATHAQWNDYDDFETQQQWLFPDIEVEEFYGNPADGTLEAEVGMGQAVLFGQVGVSEDGECDLESYDDDLFYFIGKIGPWFVTEQDAQVCAVLGVN